MAAPWTREDRLVLKEAYNVMPIDDLALKLGRSAQAIRNQVNYLRKRGWTFNRVGDTPKNP